MSTIPPSVAPVTTIDRSAAASAKGPRLQRLRAALFLLEAVADDSSIQAYAAVEAKGDAAIVTASANESTTYSEEDKNYGADGAFTFVSEAVINSVVIFADQWLWWRASSKLRLGLYTTVNTGKEKNSGRVKDLGLSLPKKPILEHLIKRDFESDSKLLPCVIALVLDAYGAQYKSAPTNGYLATLKQWSDKEWIYFLSHITWLFVEADETKSQEKVIDAIKKCRFYNERHEGNEDLICSALVDLFDEKQLAAEFTDRFVHASHIELLFKKVESGEIRRTDPLWEGWKNVLPPADQRSVSEKIMSVCPTISKKTLNRYQRRTADGLREKEAHEQDKNVVAMRYHIYDECEQALASLVACAPTLTEAQLESEIENLTRRAIRRVTERAKEYGYGYKTDSFVHGLVLELFDSCFLSFDMGDP